MGLIEIANDIRSNKRVRKKKTSVDIIDELKGKFNQITMNCEHKCIHCTEIRAHTTHSTLFLFFLLQLHKILWFTLYNRIVLRPKIREK